MVVIIDYHAGNPASVGLIQLIRKKRPEVTCLMWIVLFNQDGENVSE